MKQVFIWLLLLTVGLGAFFGVRTLSREFFRERTAQGVERELDTIRDQAAKKYPGMPATDAMKAVAAERATASMASQAPEKRRKSAADMFFGFYYLNTRSRVDYCRTRGVDLAPFADAFAAAHRTELSRATAIYANAGSDPDAIMPIVQTQLASVVEQDMKDVALGAQVPLDQSCALFNANAGFFAEKIALTPDVRQALIGGD